MSEPEGKPGRRRAPPRAGRRDRGAHRRGRVRARRRRAPPCPRSAPGAPGTASVELERARSGATVAEQRQRRRRAPRAPGGTRPATDAVVGRASVAPTVSAAGAPAGAGDRAEERPGGAVVPGRRDDERVEGERARDRLGLGAVGERRERLRDAEQRDARGVVRVAVAVRVDGAVEARRSAGRCARRRRCVPVAVGCQPATRIGSTDAPGATPCRPRGPPEPTSSPASSVPCRSICVGFCGFGCAAGVCRSPPTRSIPGSTRPPRYGCERSTPVSSSAIERPVPSKPGSATPGADAALARRASRPTPGRRRAPGRRPPPPGCARAAATARGSSSPRSRRARARSCSRAGRRGRGGRAGSAPAAARRRPGPSSAARPARSRASRLATRCATDGVLQHDDHAARRWRRRGAPRRRARSRRPAAGVGGRRRGGRRVADGEPGGDGDRRESERGELRTPKQTHRAQGTRRPGRAPCSGRPRRSSRRCRCRAQAAPRCAVGQRRAQLRVRRDAADDRDRVGAGRLDPLDERAHDRALVARGEVGAARLELGRGRGRGRRRGAPSSAPRTRSRARARARPGRRRPRGRPSRASRSISAPPGYAEPEQARALVERLAGGVVERRARAPDTVPRTVAHVEQQRVPAAREQARERRLEVERLEVERGDVPVQVVHRHERQPAPHARALAAETPTSSAPISPGPAVTATVSTSSSDVAGLVERLADHRRDELEMPPRRDLGHDAAVARVQLGLRGDDVRADRAVRA